MDRLRTISTSSQSISRSKFRPRRLIFDDVETAAKSATSVTEARQFMTEMDALCEQLAPGSVSAVSLNNKPTGSTVSVRTIETSSKPDTTLSDYLKRRGHRKALSADGRLTSASSPIPSTSSTYAAREPDCAVAPEQGPAPLLLGSSSPNRSFRGFATTMLYSRKETSPLEHMMEDMQLDGTANGVSRRANLIDVTFRGNQFAETRTPKRSLRLIPLTRWHHQSSATRRHFVDIQRFERKFQEEEDRKRRSKVSALDQAIAGITDMCLEQS
jgi:hypothetical protein